MSEQMELFHEVRTPTSAPLAERVRPRALDDVVGQEKLMAQVACCAACSRPVTGAPDIVGPARQRQDHPRQTHREQRWGCALWL
jgi:hypothetical protein